MLTLIYAETCRGIKRKLKSAPARQSWLGCLDSSVGAQGGVVTSARCLAPLSSSLTMLDDKISYAGYRFPPEIIQRAIWLHHRFTLSLRDVA